MSNDGRYMYHHNQGLQSHYDYSYPHQPYDTNPIQQQQQQPPPAPQHRPVRTPSAQSHSPTQQAQFNPPPSPYPQAYPTTLASYLTHPPPPTTWTGDNNWSSYSYPQQPTAPPEAFHSGPGRPETSNSTPVSPRNYISPHINPPPPSSRRDGRQTPATAPPLLNPSPPTQHKNRRREPDPSPPVPVGTSPTGLDFRKLLDSYKLIIDANNNFSNGVGHSRAPPMDTATVERMLQAASYGAQMLESAAQVKQPSVSPVVPSPKGKEPDVNSAKESGNNPPPVKRQKGDKADDSTQEGQTCLGCNATSTPEWRRGPMGPRTLCNACGLVYAKLIKKRVKENARAGKANGQGSKGEDFASSAGDSDDDYGSKSSH